MANGGLPAPLVEYGKPDPSPRSFLLVDMPDVPEPLSKSPKELPDAAAALKKSLKSRLLFVLPVAAPLLKLLLPPKILLDPVEVLELL